MSLTDDFMPALSFAAVVAKDSSLASADHESVRQDLERLLANALSQARARGVQHPEQALFGACAFADEVLLASTWPGRQEWLRHPLQQVHFNTTNAGEEFYQRLSQLCEQLPVPRVDEHMDATPEAKGQGPKAASVGAASLEANQPGREQQRAKSSEKVARGDAQGSAAQAPEPTTESVNLRETLELYLTCLALGFKGRYFHAGDQTVIAKHLKDGLNRLGMTARATADVIFPELHAQSGLDSDHHTWFNRRVVLTYFILSTIAGVLFYAALFAHMSFFTRAL